MSSQGSQYSQLIFKKYNTLKSNMSQEDRDPPKERPNQSTSLAKESGSKVTRLELDFVTNRDELYSQRHGSAIQAISFLNYGLGLKHSLACLAGSKIQEDGNIGSCMLRCPHEHIEVPVGSHGFDLDANRITPLGSILYKIKHVFLSIRICRVVLYRIGIYNYMSLA